MAPRIIEPGRTARRDLFQAVLVALSQTDEPMGASSIHEQLLKSGYSLSEPTVGRLLREFDRLGYTTAHGKLGRVLRPKGRSRLDELRLARERENHVTDAIEQMRVDSLQEVMNVLSARRGIEREIARAAAANATASDVAALRRALNASRNDGQSDLRQLLARAARNPILESLYRLLMEDRGVRQVMDAIAAQDGSVDARRESGLVDAVARHDADAAERAIVAALDALVVRVRKHWQASRRAARRPSR